MSNTNTPTQMREYRKRYRHKHPDRDKQQRINWVASIVAKGSKKCADCKKNKNIENYTHSKLHISAYCKPCQNLRAKLRSELRRGREAKLKSNFTLQEWYLLLEYFDNCCVYCGNPSNNLCMEHFIPVVLGGEFTLSNILPSCKLCNSKKWAKHPQEFLSEKEYNYLSTLLMEAR